MGNGSRSWGSQTRVREKCRFCRKTVIWKGKGPNHKGGNSFLQGVFEKAEE